MWGWSLRHGPSRQLERVSEAFPRLLPCQSLSGNKHIVTGVVQHDKQEDGQSAEAADDLLGDGRCCREGRPGEGLSGCEGPHILVSDDELDTIQIKSTHTIEIEKFVPRSEIDPRYLDAPYYLAPNERVGEESFAVIREAMRDDKVVGLGRVVISRRERIVMLEPLGKGLLATILRYRDEVRSEDAS